MTLPVTGLEPGHDRTTRVLELPAAGVPLRDHLTGLVGREALLRSGPGQLAAGSVLLVLDLDDFKGVNDAAGHHVGDRVLAAVGSRLETVSGHGALVVRLGGDEFAVLTRPLADPDDGPHLARSIIDAVGAPMEIDDLRLSVGVSVGLATYGVDGGDVEELLRAADQAMYAAKAYGSGHWRASSVEERTQSARANRLLSDLESLTVERAAQQLVVHYQPQVSLTPQDAGRVVGFEALVRWDHPDLGRLLPRQFIPLAERSGLMAVVTETVLARSLGDLPRLQAAAPGARLSLNVSRRHVLASGLVDDLESRVQQHGCAPHDLVLEVTEPVTSPSSATVRTFAALSSRGFGVSVRGFGTARSSLTALWSNPAVKEVKLDPSIVESLQGRGVPADPDAVRLLRALTSAAHELGIRVVAEGVEDHASVQTLRLLRCDVLQGWWICPPVDLTRVVDWCGDWPSRRTALLGAPIHRLPAATPPIGGSTLSLKSQAVAADEPMR